MSQSTSQSIAPVGFSARPAWVSDATLTRCVPWFRAVLDGLLITLGSFLALSLLATLGSLELVNWKVTAFRCGQVILGVTGAAIVYFTARSSNRRERQRVLVCLSIALLLFSGVSLVSLLLIQWPESMNDVRIIVASVTSSVLICIGMIAMEQRLLSGVGNASVVERIASRRQTIGRIFWAGIAIISTFGCLLTPAFILHGILSGSLLDYLETEFGEPVTSTTTYLGLIFLAVGASLYRITLATIAWIYLAEFHLLSLRPSKEIRMPCESVHCFILAFGGGSIAYLVLYALLQLSPNTAPWAVLVISSGAYLAYRKTAAKVAAEMADSVASTNFVDS